MKPSTVSRFHGNHGRSALLGSLTALGIAFQIAGTADAQQPFLRGDANVDGRVDMSDFAAIDGHVWGRFGPGEVVPCLDALDTTDDGQVDLSDEIRLANLLFDNVDVPPPGATEPGPDPSPDELHCGSYAPAPPSQHGGLALGFDVCPPVGFAIYDVFATLTVPETTFPSGVDAWSFGIAVDGATVKTISLSLAVPCASDPDFNPDTPPEAFEVMLSDRSTVVARAEPAVHVEEPSRKGLICAVGFLRGTVMRPGVHRVAKITLEVDSPAGDPPRPVSLTYVDGLQGNGQPVRTVISLDGRAQVPTLGDCTPAIEPGDDCNENGVPDATDVLATPAFERSGMAFGTSSSGAVAVDLDRDGLLDLAAPGYDSGDVVIRMNLGGGVFGEPFSMPSGLGATDVTAVDLDGDGYSELVAPNQEDGTISVFVNSGAVPFPMFRRIYTIESWSQPIFVAAADFDDDGDADLAVAALGEDLVTVIFNDAGGFADGLRWVDIPVGQSPTSVAAADLDGDGRTDMVVTNARGNTMSLIMNAGGGQFQPVRTLGTGPAPNHAEAADIDGDGDIDLIVSNWALFGGTPGLQIFANDGAGGFRLLDTLNQGVKTTYAATLDFDGDGDMDIASADVGKGTVTIFQRKPDGSYAPGVSFPASDRPVSVVAADLDGDGRSDLIAARSDVSVLFNRSAPPRSPDCNGNDLPDECDIASGASVDANGDGLPDECTAGGLQRPGDANQDSQLDLSDAIWLLDHLFVGSEKTRVLPCDGGSSSSPSPGALSVLDVNGDATIDLSDPVHILTYLFSGGARPIRGELCTAVPGCPDLCVP